MELTKDNLQEWKAELDRLFKSQFPNAMNENFSSTRFDKEWIEECEGYEPQTAIDNEVQYWDE